MYNATVPKFEEFDVDTDEGLPRIGVYAPVYARLLEMRQAHESDGVVLRGLRVSFSSSTAGRSAIQRMSHWANEDAYQIVFGPHHDGKRELHLEPLDKGEAAEGDDGE